MFSQFSTVVTMQHSVQWSSPSPPCGRKQGQARWWGRRGVNVEVYAFAGHVQYVVAVAALRMAWTLDARRARASQQGISARPGAVGRSALAEKLGER